MTRKDLVKALSAKHSITVEEADTYIETCFDLIGVALSNGEEVKLMNFGKFEPRRRNAVKRRNPRTGEAVDVPEKISVGFKASPLLKERVNV